MSKAKAMADSATDVISKAKDQLDHNARLQLVKELAEQTLAKEKEKNVSQMNLAAEQEKNRQILAHRFDGPIEKLAQDQVEADQLKQKAEAQASANKALQKFHKLPNMNKIREEQVATGQDTPEAYAAILDKINQKTSANYAKDEALYKAKNEYNDVANVHNDWLTSHGVLGDAKRQYMDAMFNLDLDNATVQEIRNRINLVQDIASSAPDQGEPADYVNWAAEVVAGLDQ